MKCVTALCITLDSNQSPGWLPADRKFKSSSVRQADPSGGRVAIRARKREGKKVGMRSDVFGMWPVKGETWLAAPKSHFLILQLLFARPCNGSCRRQQRDDPCRCACTCCACAHVYGGGGGGGVYQWLMPLITQRPPPLWAQWLFRLVRSRNMWFTSAGRLPVEPVTAAGHYRNTIQGGKSNNNKQSDSLLLFHFLRVLTWMETNGRFWEI